MSLASNITRRSGSTRYYARQWVPKELHCILNKTEVWKSLGTSDPKEAKTAARIVLQQWEREPVQGATHDSAPVMGTANIVSPRIYIVGDQILRAL